MKRADAPGLLYHYTDRVRWEFIRRGGIDRGITPVSLKPREGIDHASDVLPLDQFVDFPNLTADPNIEAQFWHRWDHEEEAKDPSGVVRKRVRLTVRIPWYDGRLISYRRFALGHKMPRRDYRVVCLTGGGGRHWWIYRGKVRPEWIAAVDFFDGGRPTQVEAVLSLIARHSASYDVMMARIGARRAGDYTAFDPAAVIREHPRALALEGAMASATVVPVKTT